MKDLESQSELCVFDVTKKPQPGFIEVVTQSKGQNKKIMLANSGKVMFAGAGKKDMAATRV